MTAIKSFKDLDAWRVSMDLAVLTYRIVKQLPSTERYGLTAQMRRTAVSVPSNVAEGQATGRGGRYLLHVRIGLGSVGELTTCCELAKRLELLPAEATVELDGQLARTSQLLHGLARSVRARRFATATAWLALLAGLALG